MGEGYGTRPWYTRGTPTPPFNSVVAQLGAVAPRLLASASGQIETIATTVILLSQTASSRHLCWTCYWSARYEVGASIVQFHPS
jgi:hypothetical protein